MNCEIRDGSLRMLDMHAHLLCLSEEYAGKLSEQEAVELGIRELFLRRKYGVDTVFSCGTPQEWEFMKRCLKTSGPSGDLLSFGIHPWQSGSYRPQGFREYFTECPIVGEIGMDSVWCGVPLDVQRRVFVRQLEIAAELEKPVVLHTKGQEAQIAELIRDFPGKICVHWYSGDLKSFEKFLEAGCYFTLGPDLAEKCRPEEARPAPADRRHVSEDDRPARLDQERMPGDGLESTAPAGRLGDDLYACMLREVPADRLFLETDGLSSIAWMRGADAAEVPFEEIQRVLSRNLRCAACAKQMTPEALGTLMRENLRAQL